MLGFPGGLALTKMHCDILPMGFLGPVDAFV